MQLVHNVENSLLTDSNKQPISLQDHRPLKVLRLSHSAGVTTYRERERQLQDKFNVEIKLIAPERWQHLGASEDMGPETFDLETVRTFGTGSIPLFAYDPGAVLNALIKFQPDVVDIHEEPYSVSCFETVLLARLVAPKAARVFYSAQNISKRYPPPFCFTEQFVYKTCQGAYPCSEGVKDVLTGKGFETNSRVIPLGVDPAIFKPERTLRSNFGIADSKFVVGYFGRLEECKGVQYLLHALSLLPESIDFHALAVGTGPFEKSLRQQANQLFLQDRVVWTGEVAGNSMPAYFGLCDVVVVPSLTTQTWKEQFGRVVIEAMACGIPIVAFDSGSLPEVVADAGIIVAENNTEALAEAISQLASDRLLRNRLSTRGLELVMNKYTWQKVAQQMHQLYLDAIQLKSALSR